MPCSPASADAPFALLLPAAQTVPLVLASPHSGRAYDAGFLAAARLRKPALRRFEDPWVDELFAGAPARGAPLLAARFPRACIDANREPFELDPEMFAEPLPRWINRHSAHVRGGLGTIPRRCPDGAPIYDRPLRRAEARRRLAACYLPYHRALKGLLRRTRARFGHAALIDCHSMPSRAVERLAETGAAAPRRVDFVLGDRRGAACHPELAACAENVLSELGFRVVRNAPFAGGFATRFYGRPRQGVQALQIEINRALYMDEARHARGAGMAPLAAALDRLVEALGALWPAGRAAPAPEEETP